MITMPPSVKFNIYPTGPISIDASPCLNHNNNHRRTQHNKRNVELLMLFYSEYDNILTTCTCTHTNIIIFNILSICELKAINNI